MKKLTTFLVILIFISNCSFVSKASEQIIPNSNLFNEAATFTDLGYVVTVEYEITEIISNARAGTKTATKTATCTANGEIIATIQLTATFTYTGSSASCISASASYTMASGWSYSNKVVSYNGNTATTSAKLSYGLNYVNVTTNMQCSNSGTIS